MIKQEFHNRFSIVHYIALCLGSFPLMFFGLMEKVYFVAGLGFLVFLGLIYCIVIQKLDLFGIVITEDELVLRGIKTIHIPMKNLYQVNRRWFINLRLKVWYYEDGKLTLKILIDVYSASLRKIEIAINQAIQEYNHQSNHESLQQANS